MSVIPWVRESLQQAAVPFTEIHHLPTYTAQGLAHEEHISGHQVLKVVLVISDEGPVALVLPATKHVAFDRLSEILGGQYARLATEQEMADAMKDSQIGAPPPLRHWGFDLWMDRGVGSSGDILFQAGTHQDAIRMRFEDWFKLAKPRVESFAR